MVPSYIWLTHQQIGVKGEPDRFARQCSVSEQITEHGWRRRHLYISDLEGMSTVFVPKDDCFSGGCAAIEALGRATALIQGGLCDVVTIGGRDHFATGYKDDARQKIIDAVYKFFSSSAEKFCTERKINAGIFFSLLSALNTNYEKAFDLNKIDWHDCRPFGDLHYPDHTGIIPSALLPPKAVNYVGDLMVTTAEVAKELGAKRLTQILDVETHEAKTGALSAVKTSLEGSVGIKISKAVEVGARLEVCPLAPVDTVKFLQETGLITFVVDMPAWLSEHSLTVDGRREFTLPWSMISLRGIIELHRSLSVGGPGDTGIIHAASANGQRQAMAVMQRVK